MFHSVTQKYRISSKSQLRKKKIYIYIQYINIYNNCTLGKLGSKSFVGLGLFSFLGGLVGSEGGRLWQFLN